MIVLIQMTLITFLYAQAEVALPTEDHPIQDYISIMASAPAKCNESAREESCEKHIVFDKATDDLRVFVTDDRKHIYGDMDINKVIREPSSFDGDITSYSLREVFELSDEKINSVTAHFTKSQDIRVLLTVGEKKLNKIIKTSN